MKKIVYAFFIAPLLMVSNPSFAEDLNTSEEGGSVSAETVVEEPGMSPGENAGWVAVDSNGNSVSGVMVCTPEVCGQTGPGSWVELAIQDGIIPPGSTLVLQTTQDPSGSISSPTGQGNVAGYSDAQYNFDNKEWTTNVGDSTYRIPIEYPGETPIECITNCLPETSVPPECTSQECLDTISPPEQQEQPAAKEDNVLVEQKSNQFIVTSSGPGLDKIKIFFKKKVRSFSFVAYDQKLGISKRFTVKRKKASFSHPFDIPERYETWDIIVKGKNVKDVVLVYDV